MNSEDTTIYRHLDCPELFPILPWHESLMVAVPLFLGMAFGGPSGFFIGAASGFSLLMLFRHLKNRFSGSLFMRALYWHLPPELLNLKHLPMSYVRGYAK